MTGTEIAITDEILIQLLKIEFEHNRRVSKHEEVLDCDHLYINLLDVVLDALGVPVDNSSKKSPGDPGFFCRDWFYHEHSETVDGTSRGYQAFVDSVRDVVLTERRARQETSAPTGEES